MFKTNKKIVMITEKYKTIQHVQKTIVTATTITFVKYEHTISIDVDRLEPIN